MTKNARIIGTAIVVTLLLLVMFCMGEVATRLWVMMKYGTPFFDRTGTIKAGPVTLDDELGWRATNDYAEELEGTTAGGKIYHIGRSQNEFGFRMFGNPHSGLPKILVIGDSFTQDLEVSDSKTYYAVLKDRLGAEVFAYGVGGYGTLQEYMVLDRYVDLVKPDLLLWQYCSNDFINNDPTLELASTINNNAMRRPYWVNQSIVYQLPKGSLAQFREWVYRYSRFLYVILSRLDKLRAIVSGDTVEKFIVQQGFRHKEFVHAVEITDALMGRVRSRVGNLPILAFNCTTQQPYTEAFQQISSRHGIIFLKDVAEVIKVAQSRGEDVLASDEHWDELGNNLVGEAISRDLSLFRGRSASTAPHS